ncbi:uroporphyrinogen-III C-methyltransferase [Metabacillus malikii]|uniref:uroporphyrinogen-III C-methyltransferase n=1 Tax=Metabacillus malikii TaxID=1504265 RepID=UPI0027D88786|nr:uroporphyrinogen-III C-methyltransferase [Metabacillus malikii]
MAKVFLVGAGPGDCELLTIKALKCIQKADVILYDRLVNKDILKYAKKECEKVYCGKLPKYHTMKQETINHFLVKYANMGKIVVRLKGGDPFVFGRGGEEAEALAINQIPFEIVPGVTSGIAASSYAGIPVTHRELSGSVAFVTGHRSNTEEDTIKWDALAKGIDTLVIYMGVSNLLFIKEMLIKYGKLPATPVAVIQWGTTMQQKTVTGTLENINELVQKKNITNPSIIIVGEVVSLRKNLSWYEEIGEEIKSQGEVLSI